MSYSIDDIRKIIRGLIYDKKEFNVYIENKKPKKAIKDYSKINNGSNQLAIQNGNFNQLAIQNGNSKQLAIQNGNSKKKNSNDSNILVLKN